MVKLDFSRGNVIAIAQDAATDEVLMVAYMNEEAFEKTLETGVAHYYSRSREKLWKKGESSGHTQRVREIRVDCDQDAVLMRVDQQGAACHEGYRSCFYRKVGDDNELTIITERLVSPELVYGKNGQA